MGCGASPSPCSYARYAPECTYILYNVQSTEQYTVITHTILYEYTITTDEENNENANEQIEELINDQFDHSGKLFSGHYKLTCQC